VPNTLKIASGTGASAEVLVDGADAVLELDPNYLYIADGGEGSLHVRGGRACLAEGKGGWIRLPRKTGSSEPTGKIIVDGGEIDLTSATTTPLVWAGENGAAYIEVNGGRLAAHRIHFRTGGSNPNVLKQTGGLIDMVARVSDQGYIELSGGTKECRLE
jgi:T5SS/PEP-CTERM-associated repeat protein